MGMNRMIIGVIGKKESGKSSIAACLVHDHQFKRLRFADAGKNMLMALGLTQEELDGSLKETPNQSLLGGKTPRYAMQTMMTEWARKMIHPDIWINALRRQLEQLPLSDNIVIDDVRFPNEVKLLKNLGGYLWKVVRVYEPKAIAVATADTHESEMYIEQLPTHEVIINEEGLAELGAKVSFKLNQYQYHHGLSQVQIGQDSLHISQDYASHTAAHLERLRKWAKHMRRQFPENPGAHVEDIEWLMTLIKQ